MKNKIDRLTETTRLGTTRSTRAVAMMLFFVMLLTAIGSGSVLSAFAQTRSDETSAPAESESVAELTETVAPADTFVDDYAAAADLYDTEESMLSVGAKKEINLASTGWSNNDWYLKSNFTYDGWGSGTPQMEKESNNNKRYFYNLYIKKGEPTSDGELRFQFWDSGDSCMVYPEGMSKVTGTTGAKLSNGYGDWNDKPYWKCETSGFDSDAFYNVTVKLELDTNNGSGYAYTTSNKLSTMTANFTLTSAKTNSTYDLNSYSSSANRIGTASYTYKITSPSGTTTTNTTGSWKPTVAGNYTIKVIANDDGIKYSASSANDGKVQNANSARTATVTKTVTVTDPTSPLATPAITINGESSSALSDSNPSTITITNFDTAYSDAASTTLYTLDLYKDGGASPIVSKITTATITRVLDAGTYQIKCTPTAAGSSAWTESVSNKVIVTSVEPKFAILGNIGARDLKDIVNASAAHTPADDSDRGWPKTTIDDEKHFKSAYIINGSTGVPGKYQIQFTVKEDRTDGINIGIYQKSKGQRGFALGSTLYNSVGADLEVPAKGFSVSDNLKLLNGSGSMVFRPGVTYTVTIDQTAADDLYYGQITITSNAADVSAIARVKRFDPNTGVLSSTVENAPAGVGTAVAEPETGMKNGGAGYSTTLTAAVADDTRYEFVGWYKDNENCTGSSVSSSKQITQTITTDTVYYALFREKTPTRISVTLAAEAGKGSVTSTDITGITSGAYTKTDATHYSIYPGASFSFEVKGSGAYIADSVEFTNGSGIGAVEGADANGKQKVQVSNVTGTNPTITVKFREATTYAVTLKADNATYGKYSVSYVNASGETTTISLTSSQNIINVREDSVVTLTAAANTSGNKGTFTGWSLTSGAYKRNSMTPLSATTIKFKPTANMTATAGFEQKNEGTDASYWLTFKDSSPVESIRFKEYQNASISSLNWSGTIYAASLACSSNATWTFHIWDGSASAEFDFENNGTSVGSKYTARKTSDSSTYKNKGTFSATKGNTYYFYIMTGTYKDNNVSKPEIYYYCSTTDLLGSPTPNVSDDPDKSSATKVYVLDGVVGKGKTSSNGDNYVDVGTNLFGTTEIISSTSGLLSHNYYDVSGSAALLKDNGDDSSLIYYYTPADDLSFRVQTTITANHAAIGVRAFVMNGMTYEAKSSGSGVYYADITLPGGSNEGVLEVIPVYYNTKIPSGDYIKFYVDANSMLDANGNNPWGKNIGYSIWYGTDTDTTHGMEGGYPGQPLMKDGALYYGYIPKYYWGINAANAPESADKTNMFAGVLLSNLAENNAAHKKVLTAWGNLSTSNYQSFDYEDPYEISRIPYIDTIDFIVKYKQSNANHQTDTHYNSSPYSQSNTLKNTSKPFFGTVPASEADAAKAGYEVLADIDGNAVDIYNNQVDASKGFSDALFVVSVGNQTVGSNFWDTVWFVYDHNGNYKKSLNPAEFINVASGSQDSDLAGKKVYINYEYFLDGGLKDQYNTGDRIDGRWVYSKSTDETTLRARVATVSSGTLTFLEDGVTWADIYEGTNHGTAEDDYTLKLDFNNRTTTATAKINPVGYRVLGFYMLGARYAITDANNGYSTSFADYDDLKVDGTKTSFVNARDNRMMILVERIPDTDLDIFHQVYGGNGAHNIDAFCYYSARLVKRDGTGAVTESKPLYEDGTNSTSDMSTLSNKRRTAAKFTTQAPKGAGWEVEVTLVTRMDEAVTFYQWYEIDHATAGYNKIDSSAARGKTPEVTTKVYVDVDNLYNQEGEHTNELRYKNLDYYSDLQASADINITHLLTTATETAGLDGDTYVKVTVVNSSGRTISGGNLGVAMRNMTVASDFITSENATAGYQLKVEIFTLPHDATLDDFYMDDTTAMPASYVTSDGVVYTNNGTDTITYNGAAYREATAMVPIRYFFKSIIDSNGRTAFVFDTTKQDFYVYTSLVQNRKYEFVYKYPAYEAQYGNQSFTAKGDITDEEFTEFFTISGSTVSFKNKTAQVTFLNNKAPYENNFMQNITWNADGAALDNSTANTIKATVQAVTSDTALELYFGFPYDHANEAGKFAPSNTTIKLDNGDIAYDNVAITGANLPKFNEVFSFNDNKTFGDDENLPECLEAPIVLENNETKYVFRYWSVVAESSEDHQNEQVEYTRCYSKAFNFVLFQNSVVKPVYTVATDADAQVIADPSSFDSTVQQKADTDEGITISFIENSRNQYNEGGWADEEHQSTASMANSRKVSGDRVYSDFLLSYNNIAKMPDGVTPIQLNKLNKNEKKVGIVVEVVGVLNKENGKYVVNDDSEYRTQYAESGSSAEHAVQVKSFIEGGSGTRLYKSEFDASKLDNKNRIAYFYSIANKKHGDLNTVLNNRYYVYRAYAYIVDVDSVNDAGTENETYTYVSGSAQICSEPVYFTVYDIASIENFYAADGE